MQQHLNQKGSTNPLLISSILLGIVSAGLAGFGIWSYTNYFDQKNNTDAKISSAVTAAKTSQAAELEKAFVEREKQPYTKFNGPDDLGHVSFDYPKTWSVYTPNNGSNGDYQAYFNPRSVPAVTATQPFALRVEVGNKEYTDTLKSYESLVKKGSLTSTPITINGFTGVRLDGAFSTNRHGSSVIFKVRDKSLVISSDATAFRADFDNVILKSLDFNP